MADKELSNTRDLTYSAWHRTDSLARFVGDSASTVTMIDVDAVEYDSKTRKPVALIETSIYSSRPKAATVTAHLADMAGIKAYVVRYVPSEAPNPANDKWPDIKEFHVHRVMIVNGWPKSSETKIMSPQEYGEFLVSLRGNP